MTDSGKRAREQVSPSAFMRQLRPELYSDSADRTTYRLDAATLEYHLDTITARNQTHAFEIFCRKLCERTICPNLRPATGPEGGGDSKADTETLPVADEVATLAFVGEPNAGRERGAFAFSAKKKWADKVRDDVAGIVATRRGYQKVYCVTAQFARAKDRARVEDELTKEHGLTVTILDRTWIVEQVIDGDRKDLAFNYLGVGIEAHDTRRLGPSDYSRVQQLEDIETAIGDPQRFAGMEVQRVTEALVAAKLSRSLERPRTETEGRFARAIRLAQADGTYRQQLEANYEWIWTGFWWFDDVVLLNSSYDSFEKLALPTEHAKNLEFLCNLTQLLFNAVLHQHLSADDAALADRVSRLSDRLAVVAGDTDRPNNALEARTSLLVIRVNQAAIDHDQAALAGLWPQFSEVVAQVKGLGEFPAERLIKVIEVFGQIAGNDPGYARLVDEVAAFVSERTSEGQGALVLLKRAEQLDFDQNFEMIRLLGKAARQLTKKEYADSLIDAMRLLALAYRSAGLLWAARASCIFAVASIFIEAEEDQEVPASALPSVMLLGWIALELRHLPDVLEAIRLARGCAAAPPLTDASKEHFAKRLQEFDLLLGSQILNFTPDELERACALPDLLNRLGLHQSRASLLYALGHEAVLRTDGSIPAEETSEKVAELYALLASQLPSQRLRHPVTTNEPGPQVYVSAVFGIRIHVHHQGSATSILAAEAVIGSIEAVFATAPDLDAQPHTEAFNITLEEQADAAASDFALDRDRMTALVQWPIDRAPATFARQGEVQKALLGLAVSVFAATCFVQDMQATVERLFNDEAVVDRIAMIAVVGNSRQRVFDGSVSRLSEWNKLTESTYQLQPSRPVVVRHKLKDAESEAADAGVAKRDRGAPALSRNHRNLSTLSVIDVHLWNRAGWTGTAFAHWGPSHLPAIALLFKDADAARKIFQRWRERFGRVDDQDDIVIAIVRGISTEHPAHYRVLITSRLRAEDQSAADQQFMIASRIQTMEAESDVNVTRFLEAYGQAGAYFLMPAIWKGDGEPQFLLDLAIRKRELSVKAASEVGDNDIEVMALGPRRPNQVPARR